MNLPLRRDAAAELGGGVGGKDTGDVGDDIISIDGVDAFERDVAGGALSSVK